MAQRQLGFDDERRRSSYSNAEIPRADTYRPSEAKDRGRDRERDRDYDWDRRDDRRSDRRLDSDRRENWPSAREYDSRSRALPPLNTDVAPVNAPTGPRNLASTSSNKSPAVIHSALPPTLPSKPPAPDHLVPSIAPALSPSITHMQIPKAKDPNFQPLTDLLCKLCDDIYWRSIYGSDRATKKKELEKREVAAKKWQAQTEDFPQQRELFRKAKERNTAEFEKIDAPWKQVNGKLQQHIEAVVAAIFNGTERQAVPECYVAPSYPDPTSSIAALDAKLAAFQTELVEAQKKIRNLEADRRNSDNIIDKLKSECEKANDRAEALKLKCEKANEKASSLESLLQERVKQDVEVNAVIADVADLKKRSKKHTTEKLKLSEDMAGLEKRMADLKLLQKDIIKLQKSSTASGEHITKLQQSSESSTERIASMQREMYTLQSSFTQLEGRTASAGEVEKATQVTKQLLTESSQAKQTFKDFECQLNEQKNLLQQYRTSREIVEGLQSRILTLDKEVLATKLKTEDLDIEHVQLVLDQWSMLDVDQTIRNQEDRLTRLTDQVHKLTDLRSITERSQAHASSNDEGLKEVENLRISLQQVRGDVSGVTSRLEDVKSSLVRLVKMVVEEGQDVLADMVDGMSDRVDGVIARIDTLESKGVQARTPAPTPQLDSCSSPASVDPQLVARVKAIEDSKLGDQVSKLSALISESVDSISKNQRISDAEFQKITGSLHEHSSARDELRNEVRGQLEQQEFQLQNLNSHINNLNTQAMAQTILRHLDTYATKLGPRIDIADSRLNDIDRRLAGLQSLVEATGSMFQQQSSKRPVSPGVLSDDASKRRRVDTNGGHAPALAVRHDSRSYQ